MRWRLARLLLLFLCVGCSAPGTPEAQPTPTGPPTVDYALVTQHAQQFNADVPNRPAGSQHELAAATYILGHLQFAGYAPVLDAVPVRDQVQSTNVVALPPNGDDPEIVLAIGYDDDGGGVGEGAQIGLFLELARAVNVAAPDHRVAFVALGAEDADHAGSAKLGRTLRSYGFEPQLLLFTNPGPNYSGAIGACARQASASVPGYGDLVDDVDDCNEGFGYSWLDGAVAGQTRIEGSGTQAGAALLPLLVSTAE